MEHRFPSKLDEYYQRFLELQEKLKRSEEQRFLLETKFNQTVQMAKEEERAHYRKLRAQYKRFLEEDRKRQDRNERIMRHLERIETRIAMLSAKTERINLLRRQYQSFLVPNQLPEPSQPDRSNEETIQILDKYLETMSRQRGNDMPRPAEPLEPTANQAASYADGILSSICSRHYNKDLHLVRGKTQVPHHQAVEVVEAAPDPETTHTHIEPVQLPQAAPQEAVSILQEITVVAKEEPTQSTHLEPTPPEHVPEAGSRETHQESCEQGLLQQPNEANIEAPSESQPFEENTEQELYESNEQPQDDKTEPNDQQTVGEERELYRENDKTEPNDQQTVGEERELYRENDKTEPNDQQTVGEERELYRQNDKTEPSDQQSLDEKPELYQQIDSNGQLAYEQKELYQQNEQPEYEETAGYDQYGQLLLYNQHGELVPPQYDETGQMLPQYDSEGLPLTLYDQNGQQYDHNRQPVVHYDDNGLPVYEYYTGEEIPQYDASLLQGQEDSASNQYYAEKEPNPGLEEGYYSQPHADELAGTQEAAEHQLQRDQDPESTEDRGESKFPPHLQRPADADALEESVSNDQEPEEKTVPDDCTQPAQPEPENKLDIERPREPDEELQLASVMDILDTDTETSRENVSKLSHDSDFDIS